jgi:glycosyltransferase involved in cell wall biosynthesis
MQKKVDSFICFAGIDWWYHNRAHSEVQIMRNISKHIPVLFVNSIGMRTPKRGVTKQPARRIMRKLKSIMRGLVKVDERMWVYTPIILPPSHKKWRRELNSRFIALQVKIVIKLLGLGRCARWVTIPTAYEVARRIRGGAMIFNRCDAFSKFPEANEEHIRWLEDRLINDSDAVVYVNRKLMEADGGKPDKKFYIGHGVDYELFSSAGECRHDKPDDLKGIKGPVAGFFGSIDNHTMDMELMKNVMENLKDVSFVMIGREAVDISEMARLDNVHFLGFKDYEQIPVYGSFFDVGIMPWLESEWIEYCNPVKLKEYLSLGLPVVTTPIPQVDEFGDVLYVGSGCKEFGLMIRRALEEDSAQRRLQRKLKVEGDSWHNKARDVIELANGCKDNNMGGEYGQEA